MPWPNPFGDLSKEVEFFDAVEYAHLSRIITGTYSEGCRIQDSDLHCGFLRERDESRRSAATLLQYNHRKVKVSTKEINAVKQGKK